MTQSKQSTTNDVAETSTSPIQLPTLANPDREPVLILVIGSEKGIEKIVQALYLCHFAEVREWSRLLPAQTFGKLMRSLIRYVFLD